jgi:hypothetical protein
VYLDTEERRRFAQKGHEYLIEQVQHTGADTIGVATSKTVRLSYNHPVKELVWCVNESKTSGATSQGNELFAFCKSPSNVVCTADLNDGLASNVFVEPHKCGAPMLHIGGGNGGAAYVESASTSTSNLAVGPLSTMKLILNGQDRFKEQSGRYFNQYQPLKHHSGNPMAGVYAYSFALQPEEHQPTGTCNFSRIDNAQVQLGLKSGETASTSSLNMFAVNYNVLRIQSGMGGLAFSN